MVSVAGMKELEEWMERRDWR